jgi:5-methylcytosine-specific restriction enzyme A
MGPRPAADPISPEQPTPQPQTPARPRSSNPYLSTEYREQETMALECEFHPVDETHLKREKAIARELRQTQWWKNLRGRGKCYYCKRRFPAKSLTMDHLIPISRGGTSKKSNIVPCCKECNNKKKYLLPVEWDAYLKGRLDQH